MPVRGISKIDKNAKAFEIRTRLADSYFFIYSGIAAVRIFFRHAPRFHIRNWFSAFDAIEDNNTVIVYVHRIYKRVDDTAAEYARIRRAHGGGFDCFHA
jgi:hypothetical protein